MGHWSKIRIFFHVFISGKINQQNVFDVILESQKAFLDHKKQKVKKVEKSGFFPKGLVHGFGKKFDFFSFFFTVGLIGQENVFVVILERKKAFLDSKITKLKKSKFWYFFKGAGVGPLVKNLKFFPCFYFWQDQPPKFV